MLWDDVERVVQFRDEAVETNLKLDAMKFVHPKTMKFESHQECMSRV